MMFSKLANRLREVARNASVAKPDTIKRMNEAINANLRGHLSCQNRSRP